MVSPNYGTAQKTNHIAQDRYAPEPLAVEIGPPGECQVTGQGSDYHARKRQGRLKNVRPIKD